MADIHEFKPRRPPTDEQLRLRQAGEHEAHAARVSDAAWHMMDIIARLQEFDTGNATDGEVRQFFDALAAEARQLYFEINDVAK